MSPCSSTRRSDICFTEDAWQTVVTALTVDPVGVRFFFWTESAPQIPESSAMPFGRPGICCPCVWIGFPRSSVKLICLTFDFVHSSESDANHKPCFSFYMARSQTKPSMVLMRDSSSLLAHCASSKNDQHESLTEKLSSVLSLGPICRLPNIASK